MSPSGSHQQPFMKAGCVGRLGPIAWTVALFSIGLAQAAVAQTWTAPPPPEVPPTISAVGESDLDGNRLDDELEAGMTLATIPSPLYQTGKSIGGELLDERQVDVELIFDEPVTQEQIDTFLTLGGEITYMYEAVSYGWNGRIASGQLDALPSAMGPALVLVTPAARKAQLYLDLASQYSRARAVWQPGFAGRPQGFRGNSDTTIGIVDTGVDSTHADLSGRCVYWSDISGEVEPNPVDYYGHGSRVAGVAVGTGQSAGADDGELRYTYAEEWASWAHIVDPIVVPSGMITVTSKAWWSGPVSWLDLVCWMKGDAEMQGIEWIGDGQEGMSGISLTNTFHAIAQRLYSPLLANYGNLLLDSVVITTSVANYPGTGDGFNKFSGVAPGCNYAAVKIATSDGWAVEDGFAIGVDRLVAQRVAKKIKIINISGGLSDDAGFPLQSAALRDKITSAVRSGVIVVAAAGNSADELTESFRMMADPARAALAITVGASNDENRLAGYSTYGYVNPRDYASEDFKPDLIAPGGDYHYTTIMSVDSGTCDGIGYLDKVPNDYSCGAGTSFSSPIVSGAAALVIEALEQGGLAWDFTSDEHPRLVKMLLCATATETNTQRQGGQRNPQLERNVGGPDGFPAGKDRFEGYGLLNIDAAVEAACSVYAPGSSVTAELGDELADRRAWAAVADLSAGCGIDVTLHNPTTGDFDLFIYSMTPSATGTPVLLASSTASRMGGEELASYTPQTHASVLLVVKRISGSGIFELGSLQAGPPLAQDSSVSTGLGSPVTVTLVAVDDGAPNPPGQLTYTIVSLPQHGTLEHAGSGSPIASVPATLAQGIDQVVYRPDGGWIGDDSFTFRADDGGTAPFGGRSNTATVTISVVSQITAVCKIAGGDDDAYVSRWSTYQKSAEPTLSVGQYMSGMRFRNVEIPQGADIIEARLRICAHSSGLRGQIKAWLRAEDADNPGPFSISHRVNAVTMTDASENWNWDDAWQANAWYESPDIKSLVQEVVDRSGWSSGNALVLLYGADSYDSDRKFWAYEGDPAKAVELVVVYQP